AAIEAVHAHVVPAMGLTGGAVDGQRRPFQRIVRTAHAAPRRRLSVLLNCHVKFSSSDGRPLRSRRYKVIFPARPKRAPGYHTLPCARVSARAARRRSTRLQSTAPDSGARRRAPANRSRAAIAARALPTRRRPAPRARRPDTPAV